MGGVASPAMGRWEFPSEGGGLVNLCSGVLVWHPDVAEDGDESWFRTHDFMELIHGLRRDKTDLWT